MIWWRNIPFFLVWTPLLFASITAAVKPKLARFLILLFPALGVVLAGV